MKGRPFKWSCNWWVYGGKSYLERAKVKWKKKFVTTVAKKAPFQNETLKNYLQIVL